ncbi:alpha-N-acetylgalactosaminidase [Acipenser oxyrinchus oxyrinchus]|uniref:Alpha-galactosidase n=1 Tax=Acipenser oxyrinchus oxyrinchus TaxID=40147 RepID=A0AAD8G4U8_ACIOX|nr:alpha-N-acetylgalactosaminidase [Acipenser oxyrinchus oxyrinchus]
MQPVLLVTLLSVLGLVCSLDNGLMRTPPMGWLAWERYRCNTDCTNDPDNCISEHLFRAMADRLAEDGWRALGYEYVNIDDCWTSKKRDAQGRLQPDPKRFPSGIKALADYVHAKGLKLGIYGDMGLYTCGGYPGTTLDTVQIDAETFAEWGVDMLKLDGCYSNDSMKAEGYPKMSAALNATGRPIAYSCSWPAYQGGLPPQVNYTQLGEICNLWRNYGDIQDSWDDVLNVIDWFGSNQEVLQPAAGPGHWNDPDMLIIGDFGLSYEQSKVQMALWAVLAAPLFMSNDLRSISDKAKEILQNQMAISINQDRLGLQEIRNSIQNILFVFQDKYFEVWKRTLSKGEYAVAFLLTANDGTPRPYLANLAKLYIVDCRLGYKVYDVFDSSFLGIFTLIDVIYLKINPSGVVLLHISPVCV